VHPQPALTAVHLVGYPASPVTIVDEVRAALGDLTVLPAHASREARVGGLAVWPLVGLALGAIAAGVSWLAEPLDAFAASALAVVARECCVGRRGRPASLGWAGTIVTTIVEVAALATLASGARATALLVASMVGRWTAVVQCYGGVPDTPDPEAPWVGRARFREFGVASVVAIGGMLVWLDAVGLLVVLVAAGVMLGVRLAAYRRGGGMSARLVRSTASLVEVAAVLVLAGVGRLVG
jgi:cobalamin synthase